jgi:UDP-glucose 4-epimerase
MTALVTGGAGFIGSHLVERLLERGDEVNVLDDLSTGDPGNLPEARTGLTFTKGSILDEEAVQEAVSRADLVFHLAAAVGVRNIIENPLASLRTNVRGTENILDAARPRNTKVVVISSSEVYGKGARFPMAETDDILMGATSVSRWSYAAGKTVDEHFALAHHADGLPVVVLRYFNTYGPRMLRSGYSSVVARFVRQACAGEPLTVHGDGSQTRCFTFVEDTVAGTLLAGDRSEADGRVINLGSDKETSVADLAGLVLAKAGSASAIQLNTPHEFEGRGFEDTHRRQPEITRAREVLGWEPRVTLDEGLGTTIEWWKTAGDR